MCSSLLGVFTNWKKPASLDQSALVHRGPCLLDWSDWLLEHATLLLLAFQWKPVLWPRIKHLARFQVFRVNFNVHKWRLRGKFIQELSMALLGRFLLSRNGTSKTVGLWGSVISSGRSIYKGSKETLPTNISGILASAFLNGLRRFLRGILNSS